MHLTAIVLAAGRGLRFSRNSNIPKLLAELNSLPTIIYSLKTLNSHPLIKDIVLVVNSKNSKAIISKIGQYHINKIRRIVKGGLRRQDSVRNGLKAIVPASDFVLIHDAARPFIDKNSLSSVISAAKKDGVAILGVPVKATIKKVKGYPSTALGTRGLRVKDRLVVKKTIDRNNLWEVQTPQVFKKALIATAYRKFANTPVTDDAALVEKLGVKVRVVRGSYYNIKITTAEDLAIAEGIARKRKV